MKIVYTLFFILLLSVSVSAQKSSFVSGFGINIGPNISHLSSGQGEKSELNFNWSFGFHVGGYANIKYNDIFSFQPEIAYSQRGAGLKNPPGSNSISVKAIYELHYIDLPLLVKINPLRSIPISIYIGPNLNFMAFQRVIVEGISDGIPHKEDEIEDIDVSILGGLGYSFGKIEIGARYSYGLMPVFAEIRKAKTITPKSKNSLIQLSVAYTF